MLLIAGLPVHDSGLCRALFVLEIALSFTSSHSRMKLAYQTVLTAGFPADDFDD
jgi:hypothetical protein